jgi:hypothetical protein
MRLPSAKWVSLSGSEYLDIAAKSQINVAPSIGNPNMTYVRECYKDLYEIICTAFDQSNRPLLITGTPGIGKTMFGHYVMKKLMEVDRPLLLIYTASTGKSTSITLAYYSGIDAIFKVDDVDHFLDHLLGSDLGETPDAQLYYSLVQSY